MSLSNSISLIADTYYTIDEEGQLIDIKSLLISSTTVLDQEIFNRKADKVDVNNTFNSKLNINTYDNFRNNILPGTLNSKLNISSFDGFKNNLLPVTLNSKLYILDFDNTNLANLKMADFNVTASSLLSSVSITVFSNFQGTTYSELAKR